MADGDQKASACLGCVALEKSEVLDLVLDFQQVFVDREGMEHEFNVALLGLSEVVRMSQDPEASDVGAGMCFVLCDQSGCDVAECGHLVLCSVVGLNQVVLFGISKDLLSFLFVRLEPLHRVDRQSCSQWLSQDERVSRLGKVRHCEVVVFNNSDRASSHHWPGIVDGLASSNLSLSLLSSVSKALDH